ncbi:glycosyl hydrolase [Robiginitalea sp. IMCC43444]|uniref:glycosyl hydrolase n=1 Tax=Robiginitalea sp. IMCC43444 TaxID=3459121 RepID=UPI004041522F
MKWNATLLMIFTTTFLLAQTSPTEASKVQAALEAKAEMAENSIVKNLSLVNIGPSIMSGRVVDLAVNPDKPTEFFVAYASGGLWYTNNNGIRFSPVMDQTPTQNLGAVAVHWPSGTVWAGTGENNSSRSSYAGIGLLKSNDMGKSWSYSGLPDSHHIGRISIHPQQPDEVVVAVSGHLYSDNPERGLYKTTDGGQSWKRVLYIDEGTGAIDLVRSPDNPDVLYASTWERERNAWNFTEAGRGSGIYKSADGGNNWTLVSGPGLGFPTGEGTGRIGLAAFDQHTIYAVLDNQNRRAVDEEGSDEERLEKDDFRNMNVTAFMALDRHKLNRFLEENNFPRKYRAENVKDLVRKGSVKPEDLALYLEDPNSLLFDAPVIGAEVYLSEDGGKSWKKTHKGYIDGLYYSYGYYFGQISVAPYDKNQIYISGVPLLRSGDGGKTFNSIDGENVHSDHHIVWVDPNLAGHLINGNDGGVNISYDYGASWIKNNNPQVGQFYAIQVDQQQPYRVYGGLQDNGVWMGAHNASESDRWHQSGEYPWKSIMGGDGMQVQVDKRNANIVYTGYQFGNYFRLDLENEESSRIKPQHELGEAPYRFNWQSPILLSPHNQDILYFGSNRLHRSMNQGADWTTLSPDLTTGGKKGDVPYGTLGTISESPLQFGLLYTGSDDGLVHVSKDAGASWERISDNLPQSLWVSRVAASKHSKGRVYVALNGYRWDDFTPYIYLSEDFGNSWKSISGGIPASPVNVVLEDPVNENLLFAGTDNGLYVSFNKGENWEMMQNGMPNVAVHDLVIQEREKHLLVGTHGRSIFRADIAPLQKLTPDALQKELLIFELEDILHSGRWGNSFSPWSEPSTPGIDAVFYSRNGGKVTASIQTADGITLSETEMQADPGLNVLSYDLAFSKTGKSDYLKKYKVPLKEASNGKTYLPKGSYKIELKLGNNSMDQSFKVK